MSLASFDQITLDYNSGLIPPPFCHKYKIVVTKNDQDKLKVDLSLEYLDRDELTEEEIFDEGFSMEDDFVWKGDLPIVWGQEIEKRLTATNWKKKGPQGKDGSAFKIKLQNKGTTELLYPDINKNWEILAQEIIQAVFELGKKEAPLQIKFHTQDKNIQMQHVEFTFYFAYQSIELNSTKSRQTKMDWAAGQKLLKYIFNFDYYPENGFDELPKKSGNYISPGDGFWYELTPLSNSGKDAIERIEKLVDTLKGYC